LEWHQKGLEWTELREFDSTCTHKWSSQPGECCLGLTIGLNTLDHGHYAEYLHRCF
jgi:hypothetical protein